MKITMMTTNDRHGRRSKASGVFAWQKLLCIVATGTLLLCTCASKPKVTVVEMENKGTSMNLPTPDWIKTYTAYGISRVQAAPEFKDKYCIIGEETGINKQFTLAWADNFSAQQRIGAMLRTNIATEYQARVQGRAQSQGGANSATAAGAGSGEYSQQIDNIINAIVNVSYSGAQREADWWSLRRRYDPDQKDVFSDEYTAYVLYTFPKGELANQVARALETSVSKDSVLYDITIDMAKQILQNGMAEWLAASAPPVNSGGPAAQAPASPAAVQSGIKDGTYTFWPRIQARMAGMPQQAYIYKIVIRGKNTLFYIGDSETGLNTAYYGISGSWVSGGTLSTLAQPPKSWKPVGINATENANEGGVILSFEDIVGTRFTMVNYDGKHVFEEIVLGEPDK